MKFFYNKLDQSVRGESNSDTWRCDTNMTSSQKYIYLKEGVSENNDVENFLVSTRVYI